MNNVAKNMKVLFSPMYHGENPKHWSGKSGCGGVGGDIIVVVVVVVVVMVMGEVGEMGVVEDEV